MPPTLNVARRLFAAFSLVAILGCASTGKLMRLELKQTEADVLKVMGKPTAARGAMTNKYGQVVKVWEYALAKTSDDAFFGTNTLYWLYFHDGKLVQWGEAGDWKREADRIFEIRW
jgi:hypothetical protein